jgi:hypothetical protein
MRMVLPETGFSRHADDGRLRGRRRGNFARLFEFETSGGKRTVFSITGYKLLGDQLHQQQEL